MKTGNTSTAAPRLMRRATDGRWLANTSDGKFPRIGVEGATREEAAERYERAREAWFDLREMPERP